MSHLLSQSLHDLLMVGHPFLILKGFVLVPYLIQVHVSKKEKKKKKRKKERDAVLRGTVWKVGVL